MGWIGSSTKWKVKVKKGTTDPEKNTRNSWVGGVETQRMFFWSLNNSKSQVLF